MIGTSNVISEGIWILRLREIIGLKGPLHLHMDNKVACDIAESKVLTRQVKHLEICYAYMRIL